MPVEAGGYPINPVPEGSIYPPAETAEEMPASEEESYYREEDISWPEE